MNDRWRHPAMRRIVGAVVGICFALQPLALPLHLVLEDHGPSGRTHAASAAVAGVAGDGHSHSQAVGKPVVHHHHHHHHHHDYPHVDDIKGGERSNAAGGHPPHHHVAERGDPIISPSTFVLVALALLPALSEPHLVPHGAQRPTGQEALVPSRPPPKAVNSARAPPSIA